MRRLRYLWGGGRADSVETSSVRMTFVYGDAVMALKIRAFAF